MTSTTLHPWSSREVIQGAHESGTWSGAHVLHCSALIGSDIDLLKIWKFPPPKHVTNDSGLWSADTTGVQENAKTANIEIMIFFMMTSRLPWAWLLRTNTGYAATQFNRNYCFYIKHRCWNIRLKGGGTIDCRLLDSDQLRGLWHPDLMVWIQSDAV